MASPLRRPLAAVALALAAVGVAASGAAAARAASPLVTPAEPVASRTVAAIDAQGTAGLARGVAIRVADADDLARLAGIFDTAPEDPSHPTAPGERPAGELALDAIAAAYPDRLPADSVLLVGLVSGCSPRAAVVRPAGGDVALVDAGSDPDVECVVAHTIVAVVEVAADDVGVGGADRATLQRFEFVGYEPSLPVSDVELPPVADGDRRITAVVSGCQNTTAELVVSASAVEVVARNERGEPRSDCVRAEFFVATFDIAAALVPDTAAVPASVDAHTPAPGSAAEEAGDRG